MADQQSARILVVDDEEAILVTLSTMLQRCGHTINTAKNGAEAIAFICQTVFDLLLIDLHLPDLSGIEIADYAREHQPSAAILILTGSSDYEGMLIDQHIGRFDCILKTTSPLEVLASVAAALQQCPRARALGDVDAQAIQPGSTRHRRRALAAHRDNKKVPEHIRGLRRG